MIRRIQTTNDLLDVIKSCPSGVIDDIYKIEYYIQGFDTVYDAEFTNEGDYLKVVLPSSELEKLESGILMRRAYYKVSDSSYPDGYYNLTFEDNMNVWLGSGESSDPYERQYVTDKVLNETLEDYALKTEIPSLTGYATESWVSSQGYLTSHQDLTGYATEQWVNNQGYITSVPDTFATKNWVSAQGYLTEHQDLSSYALKSEIPSLTGYATENWVESKGYVTAETLPEGIATQSWVQSQGYLTSHQDLTGYATEQWVNDQGYITNVDISGLATMSWVQSQGYLTEHQDLSSYALKSEIPSLTGYATESWVSSQQFATQSWVTNQGYITSIPDTFATKDWVSSQGYLTSHQDLSSYALKSEIPSLDGYATQSWVSSQGYITSIPDTFATKTWVSSQGYLTSHQDLSSYALKSEIPSLDGYATKSWATSQFLEESKVWTGTQSQWDALTSTQQATYIIALITE